MVRRGEITDRAWRQIEPLLPEYGQSGGQWRDHRTIISGILWKLRRRGISHTIPVRKDQRERRTRRSGRRPGLDREAYRRRNVAERCVGKLKQWRSVATRYEKRAVNFRAMVVIASLMIWLSS